MTTKHADLLPPRSPPLHAGTCSIRPLPPEQIITFDEVLSDLVEAALARTGLQQNVDMRKISAWVAIAAVPTMIAGIYGMNFADMPELSSHWGYPGRAESDGNDMRRPVHRVSPQPVALTAANVHPFTIR